MAIELVEEELPTYITNVLLLCVECKQPIKARINTANWIRVEWIGPNGECQACYNQKREAANVVKRTTFREDGGSHAP